MDQSMRQSKPLKPFQVTLNDQVGEVFYQDYMAEDFGHAEEQAECAYPNCEVETIRRLVPTEPVCLDPSSKKFVDIPKTWNGVDDAKKFDLAYVDQARGRPAETREGFATVYFQVKDQPWAGELFAIIKLPKTPIREFLKEFMSQLEAMIVSHIRKHYSTLAGIFNLKDDVAIEAVECRRIVDHNGKVIVP